MDALEESELQYDILEVKFPALYGICKQAMLERYWFNDPEEFRPVYHLDDSFPGVADEVYRYYWQGTAYDRYLLCWEDRIVEIRFEEEPTPEQMAIAADILKTA